MVGLAPPLQCLIEIQSALRNGEPVRTGLMRYLASKQSDLRFAHDLRRFTFAWDQGKDWRAIIAAMQSPYRRALMDVIATALAGQPVLQNVEELKGEIISAVDLEIKHHIELLPIKMLIPLLFFQFPAFLILLFGPLLNRLLEELNK